jgi:hypothetical protein
MIYIRRGRKARQGHSRKRLLKNKTVMAGIEDFYTVIDSADDPKLLEILNQIKEV